MLQTIDEVKDYLKQVEDADKMINVKSKRLEELRLQSTCVRSPSYSSDRVQTSPTGDALPRIIAKIVDLQEEINADIDRFIDLKAKIMHTIDLIDDADVKVVLYARYFEYKNLTKVAKEVHSCKRTVQRLHRKGLEILLQYLN